jgi:hypothetical protein
MRLVSGERVKFGGGEFVILLTFCLYLVFGLAFYGCLRGL